MADVMSVEEECYLNSWSFFLNIGYLVKYGLNVWFDWKNISIFVVFV